MRKGIVRIITGLLLLVLQAVSVAGNGGNPSLPAPVTTTQLIYDLIFYVSYYSAGISGVILLIFGIRAFIASSPSAEFEYSNRYERSSGVEYCKFCNGTIDWNSKKCTGCGKQHSHMPSMNKRGFVSKVIVVLSLLIVGLFAYRNIQYRNQVAQLTVQLAEQSEAIETMQSDLESAKSALDVAKSDVSEIQNKYRAKFSEAYNLSEENEKMKPVFNYCIKNLVFATTDYGLYHKPDCFMCKFEDFSIEAYTPDIAKQKGYTPCWLCCD